MRPIAANLRWWIAGSATALAGVALARLIAPTLAPTSLRLVATVGGQLLSLAGLTLICIGVSRRLRRTGASFGDPGNAR